MNNPEVTMHVTGNGRRFELQDTAIRAAAIAIQLALQVPAPLRSIADQIVRSAAGVLRLAGRSVPQEPRPRQSPKYVRQT